MKTTSTTPNTTEYQHEKTLNSALEIARPIADLYRQRNGLPFYFSINFSENERTLLTRTMSKLIESGINYDEHPNDVIYYLLVSVANPPTETEDANAQRWTPIQEDDTREMSIYRDLIFHAANARRETGIGNKPDYFHQFDEVQLISQVYTNLVDVQKIDPMTALQATLRILGQRPDQPTNRPTEGIYLQIEELVTDDEINSFDVNTAKTVYRIMLDLSPRYANTPAGDLLAHIITGLNMLANL